MIVIMIGIVFFGLGFGFWLVYAYGSILRRGCLIKWMKYEKEIALRR
jgi:hypothetical protein